MYAFIIPKTSHVCLSSTGGLKRTRTLPCFVWQSEQWSKRRPHIWVGPDTAPYIVLESSTTKVTKNQVYISMEFEVFSRVLLHFNFCTSCILTKIHQNGQMAFMISFCDFTILSDFHLDKYFRIPISLRKLQLKNNENISSQST